MDNEFRIFISETFQATPDELFSLIAGGKLFELTGADRVEYIFKKNSSFIFTFNNRGVISGKITDINPPEKIELDWNVIGFGRAEELHTLVTISIHISGDNTILEINHSGITTLDSFHAKHKAWLEIVQALKVLITSNDSD